uniref:40S ribosomal protein S10 n=1 Tax=Ciona intestinalis TaxID=7719 RepID=F7BK44_CIOIN|nr:40S ribosomal protein S10 [Ciona intestinalis]|eukprot:XP_002126653.1 40S ribosomal protein S10 [Ciona intestinalis]
MLMPKKHRVLIYEHLFKEGVLVAIKDPFLDKHPELESVPNLHVMKACQSLKSRGYVRENFTWRHYYWILTNEGIQYLRDFLHLPPEIVPSTLKRQPRPTDTRMQRQKVESRPAYQSDRESYRHAPQGAGDKKAEAGAGTGGFDFRGAGYGRGRGAAPPQ